MKNADAWEPSKFEQGPRGLRGSRQPGRLSPASLVTADAVAAHYEGMLVRHASGRLLDAGAGVVPLYGVYRQLVVESVCIDWTDSPHVDFQVDLSGPLPFADASFDTVLLTDVLEHVPEPQSLVGELGRVLRPSGKLLLGVPFFYWIHERPHDYLRFTEFMLRRLCERAGFEVVELEATGGSPEVVLDLIAKHSLAVPGLAKVLGPLFAELVRLPPIRSWSRKTTVWYPLGYAVVARRLPQASA